MSIAIIELNDSEIRLAMGTDIILRQPGYAVLKPDNILTGEYAYRIARSNPRATYNRYWSQLNQDVLAIPTHLARHNADLAYAQLLAIYELAGKPQEVLFAVPGSYSREQLALLLGIVQASPFTAVGLVDTATACISATADTGNYSYLDIHLHYAIITTLEVTDKVTRTSVRTINETGMAQIYDSCISFIADVFIDQSRFDPLHHAETEQSLYDQLPQCLRTMQTTAEVVLEVSFQNKRYQAKFFSASLLKQLKKHYEPIYRELAAHTTSLIGDRLHALPGFTESLDNTVVLDEQCVFQGCNYNLMHIRNTGPSLNFITSLPASSTPVISAGKTIPAGKRVPISSYATHVLINNRAWPLSHSRLFVSANGQVSIRQDGNSSHCSVRLGETGAELRPESDLPVFLNGNRISEVATTVSGDTINLAGSVTIIRLIEVVAD